MTNREDSDLDTATIRETVTGTHEDALRTVFDMIEKRRLTSVSSIRIDAALLTFGGEASNWEIEVEGVLP